MNIVTINDEKYPKLLKKIGNDAPKQLYFKGAWPPSSTGRASPQRGEDDEIFQNCLAVVGSRHLTSYGRQVTERLVTEIAAAGITIVSGFMYGGDAAAHKAAVRAGGRTIAVMPCGIDRIHPEYQQDLYRDILDNKGLIISEYEGDAMPVNWMYPRRNRIVAGLSEAILVVEAGLKSGTLITTNFAKKFSRKIFAVPGPITSDVSQGTLQLLKEGAMPVSSAKDVLEFYGLKMFEVPLYTVQSGTSNIFKQVPGTANSFERKIVEHLRREPMEIDGLSRIFGISVPALGTTLSLMELKGIIKQEGGKWQSNLI